MGISNLEKIHLLKYLKDLENGIKFEEIPKLNLNEVPTRSLLEYVLEGLETQDESLLLFSINTVKDVLDIIESDPSFDEEFIEEWEDLLEELHIVLKTKGDGLLKIYIIEEDHQHHIKIGVTKNNVSSRIRTLQTGSSSKIKHVKSYYDPSGRLEGKLHKMFKKNRIQGEWFHSSCKDEVLEYCKSLNLTESVDWSE